MNQTARNIIVGALSRYGGSLNSEDYIVRPDLEGTVLKIREMEGCLQFGSDRLNMVLYEGPIEALTVVKFVEGCWFWKVPATRYKNKYGNVVLEVIGSSIPVEAIDGTTIVDGGYGFDLDTAAKIALITENRGIQLAYNSTRKKCYVVYHHTSRVVQVARLDELVWLGDDPHATLEHLNRTQNPRL